VCGGKATLADTGGWYVEPAIFDNVTPDMSIARDEVFGPVLCVIAYQDVDEAVRIANDTCYGLAASLWTDNVNHAHKVAAKIRAGTVTVNCFGEGDLSTPFGGFQAVRVWRARQIGLRARSTGPPARDVGAPARTIVQH
jgi:gamma-glutamyl-gamma-aminobutyraldehyde dehydrogenase